MLFLNLKCSAEKVFCLVKDSVLTNVQWQIKIKIEKKTRTQQGQRRRLALIDLSGRIIIMNIKKNILVWFKDENT